MANNKKRTPQEWYEHYANLDYSRMPKDIWEDHLASVTLILDEVERGIEVIDKALQRLCK